MNEIKELTGASETNGGDGVRFGVDDLKHNQLYLSIVAAAASILLRCMRYEGATERERETYTAYSIRLSIHKTTSSIRRQFFTASIPFSNQHNHTVLPFESQKNPLRLASDAGEIRKREMERETEQKGEKRRTR